VICIGIWTRCAVHVAGDSPLRYAYFEDEQSETDFVAHSESHHERSWGMMSAMSTRNEVSSRAVVDGMVGDGCHIDHFVVIRTGAQVGDSCRLGAHSVVGSHARLEANCVLHPGVVVGESVILDRDVEVFPSAVIGRHPSGAGATARSPSTEQTLRIGPGCSIGAHATIYYGVVIGEGTLVGDGASIREGARIGRRCIISRCVTLNYDVLVGDDVKIMDNTHVTGGTIIGDGAFVSLTVGMTNDNSPTDPVHDGERIAGPVIKARAVIGAGATLLPGIVIGEDAVVAAGAVVTRDVAPGGMVMGVPARPR
jgi:acetyltransferase-like isoleucine patch superfamily enzyme